jgi:hypothetical protein
MEKIKLMKLLAYVLCHECGGEPVEGQMAVASVIYTRALDLADREPTMAKQDCLREILIKPKQFSCLNGKTLDEVYAEDVKLKEWQKELVRKIVDFEFMRTGLWNHYYNPKLAAPSWRGKMTDTVMIGQHLFGRA